MEYRFYQLGKLSLDGALCGILPKALERGMRAYILCDSTERARDLDDKLWSHDPASFIPHGFESGGSAAAQPVLLGTEDCKPANAANLLILTGGLDTMHEAQFDMICVMLDGADNEAMQSSRRIWKRVTDLGHKASFWVQTDSGGWEQKLAA